MSSVRKIRLNATAVNVYGAMCYIPISRERFSWTMAEESGVEVHVHLPISNSFPTPNMEFKGVMAVDQDGYKIFHMICRQEKSIDGKESKEVVMKTLEIMKEKTSNHAYFALGEVVFDGEQFIYSTSDTTALLAAVRPAKYIKPGKYDWIKVKYDHALLNVSESQEWIRVAVDIDQSADWNSDGVAMCAAKNWEEIPKDDEPISCLFITMNFPKHSHAFTVLLTFEGNTSRASFRNIPERIRQLLEQAESYDGFSGAAYYDGQDYYIDKSTLEPIWY